MRKSGSLLAALLIVVSSLSAFADAPEGLSHPECVHQLQTDEAIWVRNGKRAYGTQEAIELFKKIVWQVREQHDGTHQVPVGDLSFRGGGRMRPHRSHRDGRDIDAGYYFRDGRFRKWFGKPKGRHLDVKRQWALFKAFIDTGKIEYIFVGYRLQKRLYRYAVKNGETRASLRKLIQWPRHWRKKRGFIRWERGHDDHFHIRFKKVRKDDA